MSEPPKCLVLYWNLCLAYDEIRSQESTRKSRNQECFDTEVDYLYTDHRTGTRRYLYSRCPESETRYRNYKRRSQLYYYNDENHFWRVSGLTCRRTIRIKKVFHHILNLKSINFEKSRRNKSVSFLARRQVKLPLPAKFCSAWFFTLVDVLAKTILHIFIPVIAQTFERSRNIVALLPTQTRSF